MDMKDVKTIESDKTFTKTFTKKWWQDHRSPKAKGSGVGAAMDDWQKDCRKSVDQMTEKELADADAACDKLDKALKVAISKCGKDQKETVEGCKKYGVLVDGFRMEVANRVKAIRNEAAQAVVALEEFRKGPLQKANREADRVTQLLGNWNIAIQKWTQEAEGTVAEKRKQDLMSQIAALVTDLDRAEKDLDDAAGDIGNACGRLKEIVNLARKDPKLRPCLAQYEKALAEFDAKADAGIDEAESQKVDLRDLGIRLQGTETVDAALRQMDAFITTIEDSPTFQVFENALEDIKERAARVVEFKKDVAAMTEEQWVEAEAIRVFVGAQSKQVTTTSGQLERAVKMAQNLARRWGDAGQVQEQLKAVNSAYQAKKKPCSSFTSFAPKLLKSVEELLSQRG